MSLDNKTLEIDLYNCFFGISPEMNNTSTNYSASVELSTLSKTQKDKDLDSKTKKELEKQVKNMVMAFEKYIKSGTVETSVIVEILPQSIQSVGSPGATAGPPVGVTLEVSGAGIGEIK